ncbi:NAD(P)/FAD-dependent oxidoreductase [Kitasatospora cheerisanensis]|uniref:FAD-dependent pyridine nucleotide-disulfide oxidoreductase n=1 Tax=Kitasatospora cheerisanensis KCTC 2395 TaxID=1348663 RepID=A0A066Z0U1_9ACTN|nr:FAD-dependent oxidoreductase [Kitasatospora cheerisanensis]KDN83765.1 FAD-dependent pyridine nucleotide-disulfide oxidoreductase [Kitasatospora cheerisanensis KCTC 2395]
MSRTVVVIGGGYGGASVAKALQGEAEVVLVDPRDAFVNVAGSLRALVRPDWAGSMFFPYETLLTGGRVVRDRAVSVDPGGVTLASGEHLPADYLVLATGSRHSHPAHPAADGTAEAIEAVRASHGELAGARRVLILGAGPVGLELAGEIKEVWPDKRVVLVDPGETLLPGFLPEVVEDLHRQLDALGVELRLGAALAEPPAGEPGRAGEFTVTTTAGERLTADLWYRAYGAAVNGDYLADGKLTERTARGKVAVTGRLNVEGHEHVYAIGDLADLPEADMAGFAMQHAEVVAKNISAQLRGEQPTEVYRPLGHPMVMLPLGSTGGVGQLPSPDGPFAAPAAMIAEFKGTDLFTARMVEQFGPHAA